MTRKVILDVDTGVDDALALLLAANSPELDIVGVTCVAGNVTLPLVVRNTLAVLELARCDAPVVVGARKPLMAALRTATYFHGSNGLGDIELPPPSRAPIDEAAPDFLVRMAREHAGELTVIAVGPLTNIALATLADSDFASNLQSLLIMGGAVAHPGNANPAAEANFSNDPEAAAAVFASGAEIALVDLGATHQAVLPFSLFQGPPRGPIGSFARDILDFYGAAYASQGAAGPVLHDPLAVGLAIRPEFATWVPLYVEIETAGYVTRGASVGNFSGFVGRRTEVDDHVDVTGLDEVPFNASIARDIRTPEFLALFLDRLGLS